MATQEERLRILRMIQDGTISAEEGAALLAAAETTPPPRIPRQFRVIVTDLQTGQLKVNMTMPWSLVNMGIKMGARLSGGTLDLDDIKAAVDSGAEGKIADIVDQEANERVEIFVD